MWQFYRESQLLDSGTADRLLGEMAGKPESLEVRMLGPAEIVILFCLQAFELVSLPAIIHFLFTNHQSPITNNFFSVV